SRPLVPSMGHHDPLAGLITYGELQAAVEKNHEQPAGLDLNGEIKDMADVCRGKDWATNDLLGIGELLSGAYRVGRLKVSGMSEEKLLADMLAATVSGMEAVSETNYFTLPAPYRLAFREFGLSIGLKAAKKLRGLIEENPAIFKGAGSLISDLGKLAQYDRLAETIETFWFAPAGRKAQSWTEHNDINTVMLATSLEPDGYL
ncbi:MAG: hypothetical protein PHN75_13565, partial [Syntrophales bacterium]|nr:hypothetical protein [Syntrophales bacterium]